MEQFGIQALMFTAVHPKVGKPWIFGMHQCSHARVWTGEEQRLFKEIGRRIADGLGSMLSRRELKESEEKYRTLVENAPDVILNVDREGKILFANRSVTGPSVESGIGASLFDYLTPDQARTVRESIRRVFDTAQPHTYEAGGPGPSGAEAWYSTRLGPIMQEGQVIAATLIARDVTEQRQAEDALRESEKRYRQIVETASEGIWLIDLQNNTTFANQRLLDMFGYSMDEMIGKPLFAFMDEEERSTAEANLERCRQGKVAPYDFRFRRKDGSELWAFVTTSPILDPQGRLAGGLGMITDITDHKRAEEERDRLFNHSMDMLCVAGLDGRFKQLNPAWTKTLGWSVEELLGKPWLEYVHPEDREATVRAGDRLREGEAVHLFENRCLCKDGSYRWLSWNCFPLPGQERIFSVTRDVTERKRAEEERRDHVRFLENLERVDRTIRRASDAERMPWDVIETVSSMFDCDRAWLLYPCDPDAPSFRLPVEWTRPEYPGALALNAEVPMGPGEAQSMREALASEDPLAYTAGTQRPEWTEKCEQYGVQAQMFMALHPKVGKPWLFGMHQCSYARVWTDQESRLFKEIGRRIADGLSSMLSLRDLKDSEEKYRTLVQNAPDVILNVDPEGKILFANRTITGRTVEAAIGTSLFDYLSPDQERTVRESLRRVFDTAQPHTYEAVGPGPNGEKAWYSSCLGPIMQDGRVIAATLIARDVTEQRQAAENLRKSEEQLRLAVKGAQLSTWDWDLLTDRVWLDGHGAVTLGLAPDTRSIPVSYVKETIHPDDVEQTREAADRAVRERAQYTAEYRIIRPDGTERWIAAQGQPMYDETGEAIRMVGVSRDITERKQAEEALRENEQLLTSVVESIRDGLLVLDNDLHYTYWNRAMEVTSETPREELINSGKLPWQVFPHLREQGVDKMMKQARDGETTHRDAIPFRLPSGRTGYTTETYFPLKKASGEIQGVVGIIRDITGQKQAEDALQKAHDELEMRVHQRTTELTSANELLRTEVHQRKRTEEELKIAKQAAEAASQAKSEFLSNMSHELRTPLNAVLGYAHILKRDRNLTEKQRDHLDVIRSSGEHLLTLITDILDMSKIEARKLEVERADFSLPAVLRHVLNVTKIKAQEKELPFHAVELSPIPQVVRGDAPKLIQILLNLLSNAVKYTETGAVTLRVDYGGEKGGLLTCAVEDTGVGIPKERIAQVFEPFTQVGAGRNAAEGTGLGLAITRQLVDLMGGKLLVESEPAKGSTFTVELELPATEGAPAPTEEEGRLIVGYKGERKRVLVVDDNYANLSMLVSLLEPLGFPVATAANGEQAVAKTLGDNPHVMLLDYVMPTMDGLDVLQQIKDHPQRDRTIVIGLSAAGSDKGRSREFTAACDAFLTKPIQLDALLEALRVALDLEWEFETPSELGEPDAARDEPAHAAAIPPQDLLAQLWHLTERGDFCGIEAILEDLRADPSYARFCTVLKRHVQRYDEEGIRSHLAGLYSGAGPSDTASAPDP